MRFGMLHLFENPIDKSSSTRPPTATRRFSTIPSRFVSTAIQIDTSRLASASISAWERTGTVEAGKLVDLLVADGDPSVDITVLTDAMNLKTILKAGNFVKDELTL